MKKNKKKVSFKEAVKLLNEGKVVALPTETVYGLAARVDKPEALRKVFALKKRPLSLPLILHCQNVDEALKLFSKNKKILKKLFLKFSPGPITLVGEKSKSAPSLVTGGKKTVAVRIPSHPLFLRILKEVGVPLAAPSANPHKKLSPTKASLVLKGMRDAVFVLDGKECAQGLESTLVYPKGKTLHILRPGPITQKKLENFLKKEKLEFKIKKSYEKNMPGSLKNHYTPASPVYLIETEKNLSQIKDFLKKKGLEKAKEVKLSSSPSQTAKSLYLKMATLSEKNKCLFIVKRKKQSGDLWDAIWDRVEKASFKKFKL